MFGIAPEEFSLLDRLVLTPLKVAEARVFLFGSRARGDNSEFSDVDLLVEGDVPSSLLAKVSEDIEESLFPYRVDLVPVGTLAAAYLPTVMKDRIPL